MRADDEHLNIKQLAKKTGESESVWRKRLRNKEITYRKFGTNIRVPGSAFDDWMRSRTVEGGC